jgi:hypothetical protein
VPLSIDCVLGSGMKMELHTDEFVWTSHFPREPALESLHVLAGLVDGRLGSVAVEFDSDVRFLVSIDLVEPVIFGRNDLVNRNSRGQVDRTLVLPSALVGYSFDGAKSRPVCSIILSVVPASSTNDRCVN